MARHRIVLLAVVSLVAGAFGCAATGEDTAKSHEEVVEATNSERAEIKVVLADPNFDPTTLGAKPGHREITFYDTPSLDLFGEGVLFRSRRASGKADDVTVKLRPMTPSGVDPSFHKIDGFKCELDVTAGSDGTSSCSLTSKIDGDRIKEAAASPERIRDLWSTEARDLARSVAPNLQIDAFRTFGPIASTTWEVHAQELDDDVSFERWDVPGGDKTLEASIKVSIASVQDKERALLQWLADHHIDRAQTQTTKTAAALEALKTH